MLFSIKYNFTDVKHLESFVITLSSVFCNPAGFEPYKPNERDDYYWTLDAANDWKIKFFPLQPDRFSIIYRYQGEKNRAEEALAEWLKFKFDVTPLALSRIRLESVAARCKRLIKFGYTWMWWEGDIDTNFTITLGKSREDSELVASRLKPAPPTGEIQYNSETFLKAEAALSLFFPTSPGYRVVEIDEYQTLAALPKNDETVEIFTDGRWDVVPTLHLDYSQIYQTKRPIPIL